MRAAVFLGVHPQKGRCTQFSCSCWEENSVLGTSDIILHSHDSSSRCSCTPFLLALTVGQQSLPLLFSSFDFTAGRPIVPVSLCINEKNKCLHQAFEPRVMLPSYSGSLP